MPLSKNFWIFISRLSLAGVIIWGSFRLGSTFYLSGVHENMDQADKIEVKNFSEQISGSLVKDLNIYIQSDKRVIPKTTVKSWLEPYVRSYSGKEDTRISPDKVRQYLASIASLFDTEPTNAKFIIIDGKAKEFMPSIYGRSLDIDSSEKLIMTALINGVSEVDLPVKLVEPAITTERANNLGITTLIGRGESDFRGSSQARVQNIRVGAAKYNGVIIEPGKEFSFNSLLGEISEQDGFESELVIKKGVLVKELGGGLCQVSTTLFRSAIMAGLPILERKPHSFPVKYYNPQGFDATIYPGVVDLKFKNDTPHHILIQSRVEGTKLIFDIYGPDNGRKVVLDGPFQYDEKPNGSMKAYFVRKIYQGEILAREERFDSTYGAPAPLERNPLE